MTERPGNLRIAWFTPGRPAQGFSKSYYTSSLIVPELCRSADLELFSSSAGQPVGGLETRHFLTAAARHKMKAFDLFFYNLENGPASYFSRIHLALMPGVTWFHDFTLLDDGPEPILNSPWTRMVDLFSMNSAETDWPTRKDLFLPVRPQAVREASMSFVSLFSAERDLEQFRALNLKRLNPDSKGAYLPMPVSAELFSETKTEPGGKFRIAICSKPSVESHVHKILEAVSGDSGCELIWLLDESERQRASDLLSEFSIKNAELLGGRTSDNWGQVLDRADLAVHFLYSFYDQLQPWLAVSLAKGKFCAVLDFSESDYLPDAAVFKIEVGDREASELASLIKQLRSSSLRTNSLARTYALEKYDLKAISDELLTFLYASAASVAKLAPLWEKLSAKGRQALLQGNLNSADKLSNMASEEIFRELGWM